MSIYINWYVTPPWYSTTCHTFGINIFSDFCFVRFSSEFRLEFCRAPCGKMFCHKAFRQKFVNFKITSANCDEFSDIFSTKFCCGKMLWQNILPRQKKKVILEFWRNFYVAKRFCHTKILQRIRQRQRSRVSSQFPCWIMVLCLIGRIPHKDFTIIFLWQNVWQNLNGLPQELPREVQGNLHEFCLILQCYTRSIANHELWYPKT